MINLERIINYICLVDNACMLKLRKGVPHTKGTAKIALTK